MSLITDIADAVTAELNTAPAGTFSPAFTAVRRVLPTFELPELMALQVTVVPKGVSISGAIPMRNADGAAAVVNAASFDGYVDTIANNAYCFGVPGHQEGKYFYAWNGWASKGVLSLAQWEALGATGERMVKAVDLDEHLYPLVELAGVGARRQARDELQGVGEVLQGAGG